MGDYGTADRWRDARKAHRCGVRLPGCEDIPAGDRYREVVVFPGHDSNDGPSPVRIRVCGLCDYLTHGEVPGD